MIGRLPFAIVFLGLVFLVSLHTHVSPAEATSTCGNLSVPWPVANDGSDRDCDAFADTFETDYLGTHAYVECAATPTASDEANAGILDAWPFDFNDDQLQV